MSRSDRILVAAAGGAVVLTIAAAVALLVPPAGAPDRGSTAPLLVGTPAPSGSPPPPPASSSAAAIVVDVAGAVTRPGLVELPGGARVGDAIAAAGGYGTDADLDAAAELNLARVLADGEQVRVPRVGEQVATAPSPPAAGAPASASSGTATAGGRVDLNTATPEQLEALPGIGAVTVQKIVAARQERPFTSLDDAVQRGVIHRGQLEDIRELATAG